MVFTNSISGYSNYLLDPSNYVNIRFSIMKKGTKLPSIIVEEEFIKMISLPKFKDKSLKNKKRKLALGLAFYCCLRRSEISKLEPYDYNPNTKLLHIRQAKGSKDRKIPISPELARGVKFLPIGKSPGTLNRWVHQDSQEALGKSINIHCLRHSGASHYLNNKKWDIRSLQQFLGHSDITITQIYLHISPDNLTRLMWD